MSVRYVIGIDEVGRGPLAGPVVVCAVAAKGKWRFDRPERLTVEGQIANSKLPKLRDSKKLSERQREAWYAHLTKHRRVRYAIARVYPRQIEKRNVTKAANVAAFRAFARLAEKYQVSGIKYQVFLDGGLFLKNKVHSKALGARTVVRGDEKIPAVAMASIIAKVHRDRLMKRLAKRYPGYGFEVHKGYGTRAHLAAIRRMGPSPAHRKTFLA